MARDEFEDALDHFPDHPAATVGLSNILLDLYSEKLLPAPAIPSLDSANESAFMPDISTGSAQAVANGYSAFSAVPSEVASSPFPTEPMGLRKNSTIQPQPSPATALPVRPGLLTDVSAGKGAGRGTGTGESNAALQQEPPLAPPYKAKSLPLIDRLAARDRAYGLLTGLTKLGSGWNYSDAWFALARAHEESGQLDKAKEALWWCVELEEATGIREWTAVSGAGGYVL
jgi:cargo-transport protein YPP1